MEPSCGKHAFEVDFKPQLLQVKRFQIAGLGKTPIWLCCELRYLMLTSVHKFTSNHL